MQVITGSTSAAVTDRQKSCILPPPLLLSSLVLPLTATPTTHPLFSTIPVAMETAILNGPASSFSQQRQQSCSCLNVHVVHVRCQDDGNMLSTMRAHTHTRPPMSHSSESRGTCVGEQQQRSVSARPQNNKLQNHDLWPQPPSSSASWTPAEA